MRFYCGKILFFFINTAYTDTMKQIIDNHHEKIGIIGLALVTIIFAIVAITILPQKTIAPILDPSQINQETTSNVTTVEQTPVVVLDNLLKPNDRVKPGQIINGTVPGYYFFEGSFPVTLRDVNDTPFATVIASTDEDWMVSKKIRFSITLPETFTYTGVGSILFKKDDPSDGEAPFDPEKDQYILPIIFENEP